MPIPLPLVAAGITAASTLFTNAANARQARLNREFQERLSSTAHQREVRDLRAAGLNPILSAHGSGASTPAGSVAQMESPGGAAVSSALAVARQKAELKLLEAQRLETEDRALLLRTQAGAIRQEWEAGPGRSAVLGAEYQQRIDMVPLVLERAKAEIEQTMSSARAQKAGAALEEAARAGALNLEAFEKSVGEAGPWVKTLWRLLQSVTPRSRK